MAWTFVQKKDSSTQNCVFNSNTTTGNQIIVINDCVTGATSISISPGGGTFTRAITNLAQGVTSEIWICANVTGGVTPTVTGAGGSALAMLCYEFSGGTATLDGSAVGGIAATTSLSVGPITTTTAGDLVLKGFCCGGVPNGVPQGGWTETNPTLINNIGGYIIGGAPGSITGTDTQTSGGYSGVIVAFKAFGAGGGSGITMQVMDGTGVHGITFPL